MGSRWKAIFVVYCLLTGRVCVADPFPQTIRELIVKSDAVVLGSIRGVSDTGELRVFPEDGGSGSRSSRMRMTTRVMLASVEITESFKGLPKGTNIVLECLAPNDPYDVVGPHVLGLVSNQTPRDAFIFLRRVDHAVYRAVSYPEEIDSVFFLGRPSGALWRFGNLAGTAVKFWGGSTATPAGKRRAFAYAETFIVLRDILSEEGIDEPSRIRFLAFCQNVYRGRGATDQYREETEEFLQHLSSSDGVTNVITETEESALSLELPSPFKPNESESGTGQSQSPEAKPAE